MRTKSEEIDYWVSIIEKALLEPEENFPNPLYYHTDKPYDKSAWILNWLVMSAKCSSREVIEKLKNPPQWLTNWLDKETERQNWKDIKNV